MPLIIHTNSDQKERSGVELSGLIQSMLDADFYFRSNWGHQLHGVDI